MGTVFLARMAGSAGFSRLVAIKRLHPELAAQKEFIAMLVDEARLASSLHHVNIIDTLDLVASDGAFSLVLEYIEGAALSVLTREAEKAGEEIPRPIILALIQGVLRGLDAAHEARGTEGQPLGIVHRDISPQNVLVGTDGVPRIIDFGIAKAMGRVVQTRPGEVRGKFAYMAPEQLLERPATRQADVYAAGVVLWELLTGERLFTGDDQRAVCAAVMRGDIERPSSVNPSIPPELDDIVMKATARDTGERYLTAREFLDDLAPFERAADDEVGRFVRRIAATYIAKRAELVQDHHPDHSRSVEDLMAELAMSATPADGVSVPPPPRMPMQSRTQLLPFAPEPPTSARGLTSAGVVVATGPVPTSGATKPWLYGVAAAAALVVIAIGGSVIGLRRRPPEPEFTTMPPPAASPVEAPAVPASAEPATDEASPAFEIIPAAPAGSRATAPKKPPRRTVPKKPAAPSSRDFDHP